MKTKTFDCVEMKRKGAERIYQLVKDMTPAEELEFWRPQEFLLIIFIMLSSCVSPHGNKPGPPSS